ncbi:hypothetical protein LIER_38991 [Lithospermum erythrorhizon]|uniref:Uncharacterized protein n=1 Tax=Lithospermum erythrorhizon TaxID=34254 RepID=A0AAV3Q7Z2_LITER
MARVRKIERKVGSPLPAITKRQPRKKSGKPSVPRETTLQQRNFPNPTPYIRGKKKLVLLIMVIETFQPLRLLPNRASRNKSFSENKDRRDYPNGEREVESHTPPRKKLENGRRELSWMGSTLVIDIWASSSRIEFHDNSTIAVPIVATNDLDKQIELCLTLYMRILSPKKNLQSIPTWEMTPMEQDLMFSIFSILSKAFADPVLECTARVHTEQESKFKATKNDNEYEAMIAGLRLGLAMARKKVVVQSDSK